jgi:hypothetical protein
MIGETISHYRPRRRTLDPGQLPLYFQQTNLPAEPLSHPTPVNDVSVPKRSRSQAFIFANKKGGFMDKQ